METHLKSCQNLLAEFCQEESSVASMHKINDNFFSVNLNESDETLPDEEQLYNFLSCFDNSNSLTFHKLLEPLNQDSELWRDNSPVSNLTRQVNYISSEKTHAYSSYVPNTPRIIRGCHENQSETSGRPFFNSSYSSEAELDLNNNVLSCVDKNLPACNDSVLKEYDCFDKLSPNFQTTQLQPGKSNETLCDSNKNIVATLEAAPFEAPTLKISSFLFHTKTVQTTAGKLHVCIDLCKEQLGMLSKERYDIEQIIFPPLNSKTFSPVDQSTRIDRLINDSVREISQIQNIAAETEIAQNDIIKREHEKLLCSWLETVQSIQKLRQRSNYFSQHEYLSRLILNLIAFYKGTKKIRTFLWCLYALISHKVI